MLDILTIGTATCDVFLTSPLFKVFRDVEHLTKLGFKTGEAECFALGAKLEVHEPLFSTGGGATNAAVTFARQGYSVGSLFRIGSDQAGEDIIRHLRKEKVSTFVVKSKKEHTAYSTILVAPNGERTILTHRGASDGFVKREIPWRSLRAKWAYISPGDIQPVLMQEIVHTLKQHNVQIAMNLSRRYVELGGVRLKQLLHQLDVVVVNREEASELTGIPYRSERSIFKKFDELVPGIAVVTDGARGAVVSDGAYLYRAKVFKEKKVLDRTGAGDAFGSGFVAGLMRGNDITLALRLASANATSVVEHISAQKGILTKKEFSAKRWRYLDLDIDQL